MDGHEGRFKPVTSFDPKFPGGAQQKSLNNPQSYSYLWVGQIVHVDVETMVCSVKIAGHHQEWDDIPIPASGGSGPRSWAGVVPERNSKVLIGWYQWGNRSFKPRIIDFITSGTYPAREFEPFSSIDPTLSAELSRIDPELQYDPRLNLDIIRLKLRKAYSGDYLASSSGGSDLLLDKNVQLINRAGNELFLRDSDQTAVLQTVNEFTSNAAGYYRRGLIKRNSFNLALDLAISGFHPAEHEFDEFTEGKFIENEDGSRVLLNKLNNGQPAFNKLLEFGLIGPNGQPVFPNDPNDSFYPFVVLPDGQRVSYTVQGEHDLSFAETDQCYIEDRIELRHTSDGVMTVTEEGDGFQTDVVPPIFIEDVKGTIVGNDPYTEPGRELYKKILKMRVFDSPDQGTVSAGPVFEPVDTITSQTEADTLALARLFRIQSPTSSNQFAYGISKEGKLTVHIPKTQSGTIQDRGKSVDANILGLIKAIIGVDENTGTSLDLKTLGGIKLEIGSFQSTDDPENPELVSIDLILKGKIRTTYAGQQGRENVIGGNDFKSVGGSDLNVIGGNCVRNVGGAESIEATSITHNIGAGGLKVKSAGDSNQTILGKTTELYAKIRKTTIATGGDNKKILVGLDATTILAGGITRTVTAGSGISDSVATGNLTNSVGVGNMSLTVGAGNLSMSTGAGNLSMTVGVGTASIAAGIFTSITSGALTTINSPVTKIGAVVVGSAVAGIPGPPTPMRDYLTGLPFLGIPTVTIG